MYFSVQPVSEKEKKKINLNVHFSVKKTICQCTMKHKIVNRVDSVECCWKWSVVLRFLQVGLWLCWANFCHEPAQCWCCAHLASHLTQKHWWTSEWFIFIFSTKWFVFRIFHFTVNVCFFSISQQCWWLLL